jgi:hypothetical protein
VESRLYWVVFPLRPRTEAAQRMYDDWGPIRAAIRLGDFDRGEWTVDGERLHGSAGGAQWQVVAARRGPEGTVPCDLEVRDRCVLVGLYWAR